MKWEMIIDRIIGILCLAALALAVIALAMGVSWLGLHLI